jgi:hypothetical protein
MSIVTLTSDYGTTDHYVASLKGRLLSLRPQLTIVDVSHNIHNFDIVQAAFVLKHAYLSFPKTAIHIALVHNSTGPQDLLCFERDGHYFIMPDNGLVTLLFEEITACNKIAMQASASWKESIAACVAELADGKKPEDPSQASGHNGVHSRRRRAYRSLRQYHLQHTPAAFRVGTGRARFRVILQTS